MTLSIAEHMIKLVCFMYLFSFEILLTSGVIIQKIAYCNFSFIFSFYLWGMCVYVLMYVCEYPQMSAEIKE